MVDSAVRLSPGGTPTEAPTEMADTGQFKKASGPMDWTELGMIRSDIPFKEPRARQFLYAAEPMVLTELGILSVLMAQPEKADDPIACTVGGRGTIDSDEQPENASFPMDVRLVGRTRPVAPFEFLSDLQF